MTLVVCSQPKAGTYLLPPILEKLGLPWSRIHLTRSGRIEFSDTAEIKRGKKATPSPLFRSLQVVGNRVAQGHLGPCADLRECRIVVLVRNGRDRLQSMSEWHGLDVMDFISDPRSGLFVSQSKVVVQWLNSRPCPPVIRYEELIPDVLPGVLRRLARLTGKSVTEAQRAVEEVLGQDHGTLTPSEQKEGRGPLHPFAESWYQNRLGDVDRRLGYLK